ncbi:HD domain-containing protein [Hirsutella rhossiliensis]|uniref:5'-deoxynucleotidase n=1 Tax=Hirsutella rhossiliensis TaxID=111463 RepID=A0A9P8SHG9_9HYPO|nr:HD domain-containing protein [Hirsutella rhossiliensis]KAH0961011.1 HD domain-containing protein [Hirsutella rhossiliensis]
MGSQPGEDDGSKADISNLGFTSAPKVSGPWTVDKVLETLPDQEAPAKGTSSPLAFFHMIERLKTTKREGWRRFGIDRGESIADHMYRMSIVAMLAPPSLAPRLDMAKCIKMCLVHDMAELLVGDITPVDGVAKPEKHRREAQTMDFLTRDLLGGVDGGAAGAELRAIWQEYEDSQTLDSHFVHDVDKMELLLQMLEYEKRGRGALDLGEFAYVARAMVVPETRAWAEDLLQERERFWAGAEHVHGERGEEGGVSREKSTQQDAYYKRD